MSKIINSFMRLNATTVSVYKYIFIFIYLFECVAFWVIWYGDRIFRTFNYKPVIFSSWFYNSEARARVLEKLECLQLLIEISISILWPSKEKTWASDFFETSGPNYAGEMAQQEIIRFF